MSSFSIRTDIDGKLLHCFYNDTAIQFDDHIGGYFEVMLGEEKQTDLQVFLDMVREKGIPDHLIIEAPGQINTMMLLTGICLEDWMLLTGISYPAMVSSEMDEAMKQVNVQQLEVLRYLLTLGDLGGASGAGNGTAEEKLLIEQRKNHQLNQVLNRQLKDIAMLSRMNSAMQMCNSLEELYKVVGVFTEKLFDSSGGSLYIFRPEVNKFEVRARWGQGGAVYTLGLGEDNFIQVLNQQTSQQKITGYLQSQTTQDTLLLRIPGDDALIGVLQVNLKTKISTTDPFFDQFQLNFLRLVGLAISNQRYEEWLEQIAMVDHLTNLYNKRFLTHQLDREISRALRQGTFLSMVMIDLDQFSQVNQDYGHLVGDQYLIEFGKILSRCVRKEDFCCRYEKDEFALILVDSTQDDAIMILDRVRAECTKVRVSELTLEIAFSSGVATFPTDGRNTMDVLRKSQEVMYLMKRRKRSGRLRPRT
ncbi:MAG: GGDEF domain-containing protein [Anaerolineae bacterium]|jgi:diguanylate cyclase (GGDEF)-like protein|nr:GGDEF domain-containing protein [Anaerolineae bacterium]